MSLLQRENAALRVSTSSFAPIAAALNTLGDDERETLRRMFDIAYLLGKEKLSFLKYPAICEVKVRHGVNLGSAYKMETASKMFTDYIAESEW